MKHLNFILAGLFFLCGLCCRAQVLPLEENVVLNTKEGQIKGKMLLPGGVKTCPVVLIIAGSGPTDMDGNFNINVPGGKTVTLVISYLGYANIEKEISPSANNLLIEMSTDDTVLEEVQVVGFLYIEEEQER